MSRARAFLIPLVAAAALGCGSTPTWSVDARARPDAPDAAAETPDAASAAPESGDAAAEARLEVAPETGYGGADGGPCTPGVPRCHGDFGYQMCEQDGTWSESHSCAGYSSNGTTSYCAELPMDDGGAWATCVDPACWYWLGRGALGGATPVGICEPDGTFQRCGPGGTLAPAPCTGVCTRVATLDGRALGSCAPACEEGARECLDGSFFRACANGRWSAAAQACDGACNPLTTGARPDIRCGGACEPGTSRCHGLLDVEVCAPGGTWMTDRTCLLGRCRPAGPQAECETECTAGERHCAFDGAGSERDCGPTGLWLTETACASGSCRMSGDLSLGCVECVGALAGGGNAFGAADSRCDATLVSCDADNRWHAEAACAAGTSCAALTRGPSSLAVCRPN